MNQKCIANAQFLLCCIRGQNLVAELTDVGAKTSGTEEELSKMLVTFRTTPGLYDAMCYEVRRRKRPRVFGRELQEIPDASATWKCDSYRSFDLQ